MHTFERTLKDKKFYIQHNGDFSGDVAINVVENYPKKETYSLIVPMDLLLDFVAEYVRYNKIDKIEQADTEQLLFGEWSK